VLRFLQSVDVARAERDVGAGIREGPREAR